MKEYIEKRYIAPVLKNIFVVRSEIDSISTTLEKDSMSRFLYRQAYQHLKQASVLAEQACEQHTHGKFFLG